MTYLYNGKLNDLDKNIAQQIEDNPYFIVEHNIFQSSDFLGISASKLTKYCQKIGLTGYKELKYKIRSSIDQSKYLANEDSENSFMLITKFVEEACLTNLFAMPKAISDKKRIIIIAANNYYPLAEYFCKRLRQVSGKDVCVYKVDEDYSQEFRCADALMIVLDDMAHKMNVDVMEDALHCTVNIVHIAPYSLKMNELYTSIKISNEQYSLPYDTKLFIIITWLIKYHTFI